MRRSDITFTAGGTEAANLAIKGLALAAPRGRHLVTSPIEHEAVLASIEHLRQAHGFDVSFVEVGAEGQVTAREIEEHTSELQSRGHLVCRLLLEKKKTNEKTTEL